MRQQGSRGKNLLCRQRRNNPGVIENRYTSEGTREGEEAGKKRRKKRTPKYRAAAVDGQRSPPHGRHLVHLAWHGLAVGIAWICAGVTFVRRLRLRLRQGVTASAGFFLTCASQPLYHATP